MKQLGKFHIALDKIDSTNNYAMLLIKNEEFSKKNLPEEGTVITANYQWQGRGQQGANWHSELGLNLMASYILYPNFLPFNQLFALSQAIALGCLHCLKQFTAKTVCIKWPNDLFVEDKKIGGILIDYFQVVVHVFKREIRDLYRLEELWADAAVATEYLPDGSTQPFMIVPQKSKPVFAFH